MKIRILLIALAVSGFAVCAQAQLQSYDAAADFSATNNPNSAWTYGSCPVPGGIPAFAAFNHTAPLPGYESSGVVGWCYGASGWADPNINKNTSDVMLEAYGITWAPQMLALGGLYTEAAILRWTCQENGVYDVSATFTGVQNNGFDANWLISKNADEVNWLMMEQSMVYQSSKTYTGQLNFSVGDTLDFLSHGQQHTGFSATITQVPEPGTLALMSAGLFGLLCYAWRKR